MAKGKISKVVIDAVAKYMKKTTIGRGRAGHAVIPKLRVNIPIRMPKELIKKPAKPAKSAKPATTVAKKRKPKSKYNKNAIILPRGKIRRLVSR